MNVRYDDSRYSTETIAIFDKHNMYDQMENAILKDDMFLLNHTRNIFCRKLNCSNCHLVGCDSLSLCMTFRKEFMLRVEKNHAHPEWFV